MLQLPELSPLSWVLYSKAAATIESAIATHMACIILQYEVHRTMFICAAVEEIFEKALV